jgi:hypothetical protein
MTLMRRLGWGLVLYALNFTPVLAADVLLDDSDKMLNQQLEDAPDWEEGLAKLPAAPKDENLVPFYVSGIANNQYAIDQSTLDIGKDGVVRYVLVIKTPSGAKNVSYEGIRCESRQRKIYATGRDDGSWAQMLKPQWQAIAGRSLLSYHRALADEYFCPIGSIVWSKAQALQNIKAGW